MMKGNITGILMIKNIASKLYWSIRKKDIKKKYFQGSESYWEKRYASGGNSGIGSYNIFAEFKAEIVNRFLDQHDIGSVIEFGCGDGNQLSLINYPRYIGFDVSKTAISLCNYRYACDTNKVFKLMEDYDGETAEVSVSLDVIFHLIEDEIYENHMTCLFKAANRYVIIYSSDCELDSANKKPHIKHRNFTKWVSKNAIDWNLIDHIPNKYPFKGDPRTGSFSEFYIYEKKINEKDNYSAIC